MSGNNLGSLNKAPDYLENITLLNLSSSNIYEINENVLNVITQSVKSLDIRNNKLRTLPQSISISKAIKTNEMWISGNPFECNCDMLWMKDWLLDTPFVQDKKNVTCSESKVKGEKNYIICSLMISKRNSLSSIDQVFHNVAVLLKSNRCGQIL